MYSANYSCQILMELEFSRQIFEKYSNIKYHEYPSLGSRIVSCVQTDGQTDTVTDMTTLIVTFYNSTNAPKSRCLFLAVHQVSRVDYRSWYRLLLTLF